MLKWSNIRLILIFGVLAFLFGFAKNRHANRALSEVKITFDTDKNLLVTESALLSELGLSMDSISTQQLKFVEVSKLEEKVVANEMVRKAEVYLTIDGKIGVEVEQRKPILRFFDGGFQYLDRDGKIMPLSTNYSARVPIAMGIPSSEIKQYYPMIKAINEDELLYQNIVGIQKTKKGELQLELRDQNVLVDFGKLENVERKLANLKAFYVKAKKEDLFDRYSKIDLQYGSQVVCTKK